MWDGGWVESERQSWDPALVLDPCHVPRQSATVVGCSYLFHHLMWHKSKQAIGTTASLFKVRENVSPFTGVLQPKFVLYAV